MVVIITDEVGDGGPDAMLFSKDRFAEILEFLQSGVSINRVAVEHCVELSQSGPTVSEDITYVGRACECSLAEKVYYLPFCADCGGALPRPAIVLSD